MIITLILTIVPPIRTEPLKDRFLFSSVDDFIAVSDPAVVHCPANRDETSINVNKYTHFVPDIAVDTLPILCHLTLPATLRGSKYYCYQYFINSQSPGWLAQDYVSRNSRVTIPSPLLISKCHTESIDVNCNVSL